MRRIVLLVEGDGDRLAAPILIRRILHDVGIYNAEVIPRPTKVGDPKKLSRPGELEKHLRYASLKGGDAILIIQDCDDGCAVMIAREYEDRARSMRPPLSEPVYLALMVREYEMLFLYSVEELTRRHSDYGWRVQSDMAARDWENVRDAKGELRRCFRAGRGYRELVDQPRLTAGLNLSILRARCRSFRHLETLLLKVVQR